MIEVTDWTPEVCRRLERAAEFAGALDHFRERAAAGEVSAVANRQAIAVYEVEIDRDGDKAATIHAMEGRNAHKLLADMVAAGRRLGVQHWRFWTTTRSRARLYARWLRDLCRDGALDAYMITAGERWAGTFTTRGTV